MPNKLQVKLDRKINNVTMKVSVVLILNLIAISLGSVIVPKAVNDEVDQVFQVANEYQEKLITLQANIDTSITTLKNQVGATIKATSVDALDQIETHAKKIASDESTVKEALDEHDREDFCFLQLSNALDAATNTIGFALMNYVRTYQKEVSVLTKEASTEMQSFDVGVFDNFYDIVVKAFSEKNTYMQPGEIEKRIKAAYDTIDADFGDNLTEKVTELLDALKISINEKNADLGKKLSNAEVEMGISYERITSAIAICSDNYEDPDPETRKNPLDIEYFMPKNL